MQRTRSASPATSATSSGSDSGLNATVLARGRDRAGDVFDDLVVEGDAVAAGFCDLREVAQWVVDHEVAVERAVHPVHQRRDPLQDDGTHRDRLDEVAVADVEVEDAHAGAQHDLGFLSESREVRGVEGRLDLDRPHPVPPAHRADSIWSGVR